MMTSQILKSVNFTKIQKSRYLKNETFFLQNEKIHELHIKSYFIVKRFCSGCNSYIIDHYFIMDFFLKIREKIRTN